MGRLSRERESLEAIHETRYCSVGAAVGAIGGVVVGGMMGSKGGGSAPDPNPGMIASADATREVAEIQAETSLQYLDFYKQQYEEIAPVLKQIYESQLTQAEANQRRADEYADYERNTFRPLEQSIVADAKAYDTDAKREKLARQAAGDVSQAFGVARDQASRQFQSQGIRSDSGRFAALNNQLNVQEALARAGAQTSARNQADDLGYARKLDAAGLGRNLAPNASTAYGVALSAGNSAATNAQAGSNMMGQGYQGALQGLSGASSSYGTAGNIYGQEFSGRLQGYQANQMASAAKMQAIGSLAGSATGAAAYYYKADGGVIRGLRYANGGKVHQGRGPVSGPGGPVDDKIPAMLSDGEYVLPADTVDKIGVKKLDRLVKETHTPAAIQRAKKAKKKNGLKGKAK